MIAGPFQFRACRHAMPRIEAKPRLGREARGSLVCGGSRAQDAAKMPQFLVDFPAVVDRRPLGGSASIAGLGGVFLGRGSLGGGGGF